MKNNENSAAKVTEMKKAKWYNDVIKELDDLFLCDIIDEHADVLHLCTQAFTMADCYLKIKTDLPIELNVEGLAFATIHYNVLVNELKSRFTKRIKGEGQPE